MRKQTKFLVVAVLFTAVTLISNLQAQPLVTIDTVTVGDVGNAADTNTRGLGAVAYEFNIGKYEVTIGQYTSFLNAVAATDTYSLYNPFMATDLNIAGIARAGSSGSFSYSALGSPNRPITYVSWFDAARFANWMNNGATVGGSTETGAYTLSGANSGVITKNPGASWWIPSEDEWYKSAYYKSGGTDAGYWVYPTQSDSAPGNVVGGATNQANYMRTSYSPTYGNTYLYSVTQLSSYSGSQNYLTDAGAFSGSASAYGTYDQGGNLEEWNDKIISANKRGIRGGTWSDGNGSLVPAAYGGDDAYSGVSSNSDNSNYGFRVASVPEPSTYALLLMAAAGALWFTRKRRPIKVRALIPVVAVLFVAFTAPIATASLTIQQGFVITYGAGYDPADFPNGNIAVYNQSFIDNYISLSGTYGGDSLFVNSQVGSVVRILAFWDNTPNTRLRAANQFGEDIVGQQFVDGRRGGVTTHVSEDWLNAINADPTFQAQYGFEFKTQEWVSANAVPEPSTYALLLMTAAGALWFARKRRPIKVRALIPAVAVLFAAFAAPSLHAQLIEARAYWRGGGSVPGFLDGGGVAFDAAGNLFRTQINQDLAVREGLILKITPDGAYTSIPIPFLQPYSLALTDNGTVYAGSWSAGVAKISPNGNVTHISTEGNAYGMAADSNGNVWVGTGEKIFRISPDDDIEVFCTFFGDGANGMAIDENGWLIFQTVSSYGHGARTALPDLALTPTTVITGTNYLGNQQGFTFKGSVEPHLVSVVPNANSGDVGQRAFYTVPEPSSYALLALTAAGALWFARKRRPIKVRALIPVVAVLFVAFTFSTSPSAQADTFGSGGNIFAIQFGAVGNTGNLPDTTGYGAVPYEYRIGLYEISGDQVVAAVQLGLSNVNAIGGGGPAVSISWLQSAAFVNWLNTSSGYQVAYNLNYSGGWNIDPWSPSEAWQLGGQNLFRNKNAYYFLPSESEWYKAAYHKNDGNTANYWKYPTASDSKPTKIEDWIGSTEPNTARYDMTRGSPPLVGPDVAGGASPYGTRGQGGNAVEYLESAFDGTNDTAFEEVTQRGGTVNEGDLYLMSTQRQSVTMNNVYDKRGFRVASVPEPSTYALLAMTAAGALWMAKRRR